MIYNTPAVVDSQGVCSRRDWPHPKIKARDDEGHDGSLGARENCSGAAEKVGASEGEEERLNDDAATRVFGGRKLGGSAKFSAVGPIRADPDHHTSSPQFSGLDRRTGFLSESTKFGLRM